MGKDGKALESLVAFIEEQMLPSGFSVETNVIHRDEDGEQLAEFDIVVKGRLGTTKINWLIECRDRPGSGASPSSWIEQLVGRKQRFLFNQVTAVSTTGFSPSAVKAAKQHDIELREVRSLDASSFQEWLNLKTMIVVKYIYELQHVELTPPPKTKLKELKAFFKVVRENSADTLPLKSRKEGVPLALTNIYTQAASQVEGVKDNLTPDTPPKTVRVAVSWTNDDYPVIETRRGTIRLYKARMTGTVRAVFEEKTIVSSSEYLHIEDKQVISQMIEFQAIELEEKSISFELHRVPDRGVFVVAKNKGAIDNQPSPPEKPI